MPKRQLYGVNGERQEKKRRAGYSQTKSVLWSSLVTHDVAPSPYRELQLHHIRVLILLPGNYGDPLRGTLEHVCLPLAHTVESNEAFTSKLPYQALSYAWGSSDKPYEIRIMGKRPVPITRSLLEALRHFRDPHESLRLWADALCINQSDTAERNAQVAMMADVYKWSSSVLIWLGPGDDSDPLAFAMLKAFLVLSVRETEDPDMEQIRDALHYTKYWKTNPHLHDLPGCHVTAGFSAVLQLTRRPYFTRLWPVQEITVRTSELHSGFYVCAIHALQLALTSYNRHRMGPHLPRSLPAAYDRVLLSLKETFGRSATVFNADCIVDFVGHWSKVCSDPRDRVYALRSVLNLEHVPSLRPDYSVEPHKLYQAFTECLLTTVREGRQIHLALMLGLVGTESEVSSLEAAPSWVVDINNLTAGSRAKQDLYDATRVRSMSKYSGMEYCDHYAWDFWEPKMDGDKLLLTGHCFAVTVERLPFPPFPTTASGAVELGPDKQEDLDVFLDWYVQIRKLLIPCLQTADADVDTEMIHLLSYPTAWSTDLERWLDLVPCNLWEQSIRDRLGEDAVFDDKLRNWMHWAMSILGTCPLSKTVRPWSIRSAHRTDIAWLPVRTEVGDHVCLLVGNYWPSVIREAGDTGYRLIGDGYVHSTPLIEALGGTIEDDRSRVHRGVPLGLNMYDLMIPPWAKKLGTSS